MEAVLPISEREPGKWVEKVATQQAEQWLRQCAEFRRWEKENLLVKAPTPEMLRSHHNASRFMLSRTRLMLSALADPEFFDRELYAALEGVLWQLQTVWEMLHNPISDSEAQAVLA